MPLLLRPSAQNSRKHEQGFFPLACCLMDAGSEMTGLRGRMSTAAAAALSVVCTLATARSVAMCSDEDACADDHHHHHHHHHHHELTPKPVNP